jgi:hypothetical protein
VGSAIRGSGSGGRVIDGTILPKFEVSIVHCEFSADWKAGRRGEFRV